MPSWIPDGGPLDDEAEGGLEERVALLLCVCVRLVTQTFVMGRNGFLKFKIQNSKSRVYSDRFYKPYTQPGTWYYSLYGGVMNLRIFNISTSFLLLFWGLR